MSQTKLRLLIEKAQKLKDSEKNLKKEIQKLQKEKQHYEVCVCVLFVFCFVLLNDLFLFNVCCVHYF